MTCDTDSLYYNMNLHIALKEGKTNILFLYVFKICFNGIQYIFYCKLLSSLNFLIYQVLCM